MGNKKYKIDIVTIDEGNPTTNYYRLPLAEITEIGDKKRAMFRLPLLYPTWMGGGNLQHTQIELSIQSGSGALNLHPINVAETADWIESEATWNESQTTVPTAWGTPGVAVGALIESKVSSGNKIYFNDLQIKTDIENAIDPPASAAEVMRGYLLTCDSGIAIDTIKNYEAPSLILTLAGPIISSVTPMADNSASNFSIYVAVDTCDEDITGFDFVDDYNGTTIVSTATNFQIEQESVEGYRVYRVDMPSVANGNYYLCVNTASYQYVYEYTFSVGSTSMLNIAGTTGNSFAIGNTIITNDASTNISTSQLMAAINHAGNIGNPHSIAVDTGLAEAIIIGINNYTGSQSINVDKLHSDVLTDNKHQLLGVEHHSNWTTAIGGVGLASLGELGDGTTLTGHVKLEMGAGIGILRHAGNNSLIISTTVSISTGTDNAIARYDGTDDIQGSTAFVDDSGNLSLTGNMIASTAIDASISVSSGDGSTDAQSLINLQHNGLDRWSIYKHDSHDFLISRYDAGGTWIDSPLRIDNVTGDFEFRNNLGILLNNIGYNTAGGLSFNSSNNASFTGMVSVGGSLSLSNNIVLNGNYISNDGGNEGLYVNNSGSVYTTGALVANGSTYLGYGSGTNAYIYISNSATDSSIQFRNNADTARWELRDDAGVFELNAGANTSNVFSVTTGGNVQFARRIEVDNDGLFVGRGFATNTVTTSIEAGNGGTHHEARLDFRHGTVDRWRIKKAAATDDLYIQAANDAGTMVSTPVLIHRATGQVAFANDTYRFPTTTGINGQVLKLNNTGDLVWENAMDDRWTGFANHWNHGVGWVSVCSLTGGPGRAVINHTGAVFEATGGTERQMRLRINVDGQGWWEDIHTLANAGSSGSGLGISFTVDFNSSLAVEHCSYGGPIVSTSVYYRR